MTHATLTSRVNVRVDAASLESRTVTESECLRTVRLRCV